jgi:hypothetical protein
MAESMATRGPEGSPSEAEFHQANQRLQGNGSASRYVAARHLGHQPRT